MEVEGLGSMLARCLVRTVYILAKFGLVLFIFRLEALCWSYSKILVRFFCHGRLTSGFTFPLVILVD